MSPTPTLSDDTAMTVSRARDASAWASQGIRDSLPMGNVNCRRALSIALLGTPFNRGPDTETGKTQLSPARRFPDSAPAPGARRVRRRSAEDGGLGPRRHRWTALDRKARGYVRFANRVPSWHRGAL